MSGERSGNEKYKSKNPSLQEKKWSSKGELSSRSATLEYPSKNAKAGSLSDNEDERSSSKKKRKLFAFSKSKRERNGSGDVKKKTKNKEESSRDGQKQQRASRSNTISELSVTQLQKRLSREVKPIFEVELGEAVKQSKSIDGIELPLIVRECIDYVEEFGLDTPGIYRISGIKSKIESLKTAYNTGRSVDLKEYDVTVVTGLLKLYLRELPDPVLTQDLNPKFEEATAVANDELRIEEFQGVLKELPACNYALLSWIIVHLVHVLDHADVNKMSIQNLTIVFSPTMRISHRVLYHLFTNWQTFFGHIKLKKCRKPLQLDQSGQVQLPDDMEELEEQLHFHESFLNKMHEDLNKGVASHGTEEELWEVQRIVTQMKRKLRKAKSAQKQAMKQQEDDKSDSVDQKSTDSKLDDGSSTGTDENKLTEDIEKDTQEEESPKEEVKKSTTAVYENVTLMERKEVIPVSPEEVTVEIEEDEKDLPLEEEEEISQTADVQKEEEEKDEEEAEEEEEEPEETEEDEESLESLYLFYSEMIAKQEELTKIRLELQRRIEMEQSEVARLKAEIEAAKAEPKMRASTSSSMDLSDNSSSDSEEEEELQAILKKLREDNERLKKDNEKSSTMIQMTREECADLKAKINIERRRSEIIRDIQDELEKDKAKKEKEKKKKQGIKANVEKGEEKTKKAPPEGIGAFSPGISEC